MFIKVRLNPLYKAKKPSVLTILLIQSVVEVYKLQDCILVFTKLRGYKDTHIKNE